METIIIGKSVDFTASSVKKKKEIAELIERLVLEKGTKASFMIEKGWQPKAFYALMPPKGDADKVQEAYSSMNYTLNTLLKICHDLDLELTIKPKRKK